MEKLKGKCLSLAIWVRKKKNKKKINQKMKKNK